MPRPDGHPQVVLMCGISGSGKTRYALGLESQGYRRVSVDEIVWRRHGADFASLPPEKVRDIFREGVKKAGELMCGLIDAGCDVVVDATMCKRAARDKMRRVCREHGVAPVFVCLRAPKEVLRLRLAERKGSGPDDLIVTDEQLDRYCIGFEMPDPDETDVEYVEYVDTDKRYV